MPVAIACKSLRDSAFSISILTEKHRIWDTLFSNLGMSPPNIFTAGDASPVRGSATPMKMGGRGPGSSEARIFFIG